MRYQLREARIILPTTDNNGNTLEHVKRALEMELAKTFGGYTIIMTGRGGWMDPHNDNSFARHAITEAIWIIDVAVEDGPLQLELFIIARNLKIAARQDAIYLRLPNGEVHFV